MAFAGIEFTGRLGALRHKNYFRYWSGSFASVGATQLQTMAQGWLLYELTQSAIYLGYLGAAASIPAIIMTLFGGVLADKVNKQRLLMITSGLVATLTLTLAYLDYSGLVAPWHIILIAAFISFISGFDWPTRQAIFPTLIDKSDMMSAVALNSIIWQSSRMIMPALGGILIAVVDTWLVFLCCAGGFLTMLYIISGLKISPSTAPAKRDGQSTAKQIKEGLAYIVGNRLFWIFFVMSYASMFFGMTHIQLMPAFTTLLSVDETGYGVLISATGVGSVVGTVLVGNFQHSQRLGRVILTCAAMSALTVYIFVLATAYADRLPFAFEFAIMAVMTAATFSSMFLISSMTVLQLRVSEHLRGRVMGIYGITYSLMPLGGLAAGVLANLTSAPIAIATGLSIYLLLIAAITASQPVIRNLSANET